MVNNIKKLLEEQEMSILKLSERANLSYKATHDLVNREDLGTTQMYVLRKVAEVLNVDIKKLYKEGR